MIRGVLSTICLALALAACASDASEGMRAAAAAIDSAASPDVAAKTALVADVPPPPPTAPGTAYLVWSADSAESYTPWSADLARAETAWVDDAGNVVATRPEIVLAAGGALWAWREGQGSAKGYDCACRGRHNNEVTADCADTEPVRVVSLVELASGRREKVMGAPDAGTPQRGDLAEAPPEQGITPVGSVGPYLFTEQWIASYTCGANHGNSGVARGIRDLRNPAAEVDLVTGDTLKVLAPQADAARAALIASEQVFTPLDDFRFVALEPAWTAAGRLEMAYRFAAHACWACGDGRSSGYSRSTLVRGPVPAALAAWASAPEPVRRYWAAHPPRPHAGWSEVPPPDAPRALQHFRTR